MAALNRKVQAALDELRTTQAQLRSTLYAAHLNLAQQAWNAGGFDRVEELLEKHRPKLGEDDLRGFEWHYLKRLCHPELIIKLPKKPDGSGRSETWNSIAYSPDAKLLLGVTLNSGFATVWDAQTGQELFTLKGHTFAKNDPFASTMYATFSPDGKLLATASYDNTVKMWDARNGRELRTFKGPAAANVGGGFPGGGGFQRSGGGGWATVAFSPDSHRLAASSLFSTDGLLRVWDVQTGRELLNAKSIGVNLTFSSDGKRLAGFSRDGVAKVVDADTGMELHSFTPGFDMQGLPNADERVVFSPDCKRLAHRPRNMFGEGPQLDPPVITLWDVQTGKEVLALKGHAKPISGIAFSPDGKRLLSTSTDRTVKVWDGQTGQELLTRKANVTRPWGVAFSPDGKRLAALDGDAVTVWDIQPPALGSIRSDANPSFSPDGKRVATASRSADQEDAVDVKVWDTQTGRQLRTLKGLLPGPARGGNVRVKFSPDGKRLAAAVHSTVKVWDAQTFQEVATIKGLNLALAEIAFSPDGKKLALNHSGKTVKLWDAQTGQELLSLEITTDGLDSIAFSPDGTRLFGTWRQHEELKVWDARTGEELFAIKGAHGGLAVSSNGKRLAAIGPWGTSTVKLWDAHTGKALVTMEGGGAAEARFYSVVFSPDGQRLVGSSSGETGKITIWNAQTGDELLTLQGQAPVAFTPDGRRLYGRGADGTVKIWDATPLPEKR